MNKFSIIQILTTQILLKDPSILIKHNSNPPFNHQNIILTGTADNLIKLTDINGTALNQFTGHTYVVWDVKFSPDGSRILSGSWDKTAILWDLNGNIIQTFKGHTRFVNAVAFHPSSHNVVMTGSDDGSVKIWDARSGVCVCTLQVHSHSKEVTDVKFAAGGRQVVSTSEDGSVVVTELSWEEAGVEAGLGLLGYEVVHRIKPSGEESSIPWVLGIDDANNILVSGHENGRIQIQNLNKGNLIHNVEIFNSEAVICLRLFRNHSLIAIGKNDSNAQLQDRNSNEIIQTQAGHRDEVNSIAISDCENQVVTASADETVRIFDRASGKSLKTINHHNDEVTSIDIKFISSNVHNYLN